ncbi:hypothetical protein MTR67_034725 [Solanum verrucosum]|uniref:DUF4283 domain-containing protein n=1 Tax=Solanum verrucosum TaxID=315347 RepID=A0AAF0U8V9_SOLVR|nr:hypothetical protein MTR67_034725 [Solanum verrucosum]
MKPVAYLHGEPRVIWEEDEVEQMIIKENLEFAVIGKFSYGWPDIQDLRKIIPKQCELKGECNIGLLSNRYILIRASCLEDYVNLLSKPAYYIMHKGWTYPMRTLKWDPLFDPEEETSTAIAWISFPALPPNFFVREAVFSLATAVGKPLQVDLATRNQTRPSCARVKVEVDLLREFPKRINVGVRKKSGDISEKWVKIKYDYVPKYCKNCKIQGHNDQECYVIHPELFPKDQKEGGTEKETGEDKRLAEQLKEGPRVGEQQQPKAKDQAGFKEQKNRRGGGWRSQDRGKPEQIWNKKNIQQERVEIVTENKFGALNNNEETGETREETLEQGAKDEKKQWEEEAGDLNSKTRGKVMEETTAKEHETPVDMKNGGLGGRLMGGEKMEGDARSSNMEDNNKYATSDKWGTDKGEEAGSTLDESNKGKAGSLPDLEDITKEEKQQRKEREEDEEIEENIADIAKSGDLSPRQINYLQSGVKRGKTGLPSLPLQVKTRSRDMPEDMSQ